MWCKCGAICRWPGCGPLPDGGKVDSDLHTSLVEVVGALTDPSNPASRLIEIWGDSRAAVPSLYRPARSAKPYTPQTRLDDEAVTALVAAKEAGATIDHLAAQFQINRKTVLRHLRRAGFPRRSAALDHTQIGEAALLYGRGESLATIGRHFGVDGGTVASALRKHGVKLRPRRGWRY